MSIIRPILAPIGAMALAITAPAGAEDEPNPVHGTTTAIPIEFSEDGFTGPGGELLREGLEQAQFVMIGEDHGFAHAPLLVSAFAAEAASHGFDYYAVELGPYSADWVQETLRQGGANALASELAGRPLAIPFLGSVEEATAAADFADKNAIWGVDQEFIGSPLLHLQILQEMDPTDPALLQRLEQAEREAFSIGNQGGVLFATIDEAGWESLRETFEGNQPALDRVAAMERSQAIYQSFFMGKGLDNNLDRVELIRETFLRHYRSAASNSDAPPRVVMKFGAVHAGRATSSMSTFDLGSLIEGMAASNGLDAVHVAYLPIGGTGLAVRPSPEGVFSEKPVKADELRALLEDRGIDLGVIDSSTDHFVIPLEPIKRSLGNEGLAELDPMTRFVVLGFDYLVTTSAGKPATPLALR